MRRIWLASISLLAIVTACTNATMPASDTVASAPAGQALLASSRPAEGATVAGPVSNLELHFSRPARLGEVTVTSADGTIMPMMVTAVGEVRDYTLPLSDLGPGRYAVDWKATAQGIEYRGTVRFAVR